MVPHQDEGVEPPPEEPDRPAEDGEKRLSVPVVTKDRTPIVSAARHVPDGPLELESERTAHESTITENTDLTPSA